MLIVIIGAWIHVDHLAFGLVEDACKAPISLLSHFDAALAVLDQAGNAPQRELCNQFEQVDNGKAAKVVRIGSIAHEEIGKARYHRAEIGAWSVLCPDIFDADAAPAAHFHRPKVIVRPETGRKGDDVDLVLDAAGNDSNRRDRK